MACDPPALPNVLGITDLKRVSHSACIYVVSGTVDVGHLSHPVLMHLRPFFDLWDSFVVQSIQTGRSYISDHITFEVIIYLSKYCTATAAAYDNYCWLNLGCT